MLRETVEVQNIHFSSKPQVRKKFNIRLKTMSKALARCRERPSTITPILQFYTCGSTCDDMSFFIPDSPSFVVYAEKTEEPGDKAN